MGNFWNEIHEEKDLEDHNNQKGIWNGGGDIIHMPLKTNARCPSFALSLKPSFSQANSKNRQLIDKKEQLLITLYYKK